MSEIETREGVLTADHLADALDYFWNASLSAHRDASYHGDSPQALLSGIVQGIAAVAEGLRAARTPAQTQTFKDGFAAGLEAAAKEVDEEHQQHAFTMFGWVLHRLAKSIRALKEPS